jgi:hypothetical protein
MRKITRIVETENDQGLIAKYVRGLFDFYDPNGEVKDFNSALQRFPLIREDSFMRTYSREENDIFLGKI